MTSAASPEHLNNRHRDTLRQIFGHPVSHNIEWRAVLSLLEAVGTVSVRHNGKVAVTIGPERGVPRPAPRQGHRRADGHGPAPDAEQRRLPPVLTLMQAQRTPGQGQPPRVG